MHGRRPDENKVVQRGVSHQHIALCACVHSTVKIAGSFRIARWIPLSQPFQETIWVPTYLHVWAARNASVELYRDRSAVGRLASPRFFLKSHKWALADQCSFLSFLISNHSLDLQILPWKTSIALDEDNHWTTTKIYEFLSSIFIIIAVTVCTIQHLEVLFWQYLCW